MLNYIPTRAAPRSLGSMIAEIYKYPRTNQIEGSRSQSGAEELKTIPFGAIANKYVTIAEKVDSTNVGISLMSDGQLLLPSWGHDLVGGARAGHPVRLVIFVGAFSHKIVITDNPVNKK